MAWPDLQEPAPRSMDQVPALAQQSFRFERVFLAVEPDGEVPAEEAWSIAPTAHHLAFYQLVRGAQPVRLLHQ